MGGKTHTILQTYAETSLRDGSLSMHCKVSSIPLSLCYPSSRGCNFSGQKSHITSVIPHKCQYMLENLAGIFASKAIQEATSSDSIYKVRSKVQSSRPVALWEPAQVCSGMKILRRWQLRIVIDEHFLASSEKFLVQVYNFCIEKSCHIYINIKN